MKIYGLDHAKDIVKNATKRAAVELLLLDRLCEAVEIIADKQHMQQTILEEGLSYIGNTLFDIKSALNEVTDTLCNLSDNISSLDDRLSDLNESIDSLKATEGSAI